MTPEERDRLEKLERAVKSMNDEDAARKRGAAQQLFKPLDIATLSAVDDALLRKYLSMVRTSAVFLRPGENVDPVNEGQMVISGAAGSQVVKIMLNGVVRTVTTS